MKRILILLVMLVGVGAAATTAHAQVPQTVTFSARMTDGPNALSGPHLLRFRLYTALTGGTLRWEENQGSVTIENGLVNLGLGSVTPLTPAVLAGGPLWIEVELDGFAMSPRLPLRSVPFAVNADSAATASIATTLNGSVAIGQAVHGALPWAYETIQLAPAFNLRFYFGDQQRMMLGNDGRLQMAQTTGDCPSGWFCNGHFWDLTVASILYSGLSQRSDRRLKDDIHTADNGLATVRALRPVTFRWKDKSHPGLQHGFIAQDVQKVVPELVSSTTDGMLSVETTAMIPILAQAVKELDAQNKQLRAELDDLRRHTPGASASPPVQPRTNTTLLAGVLVLVAVLAVLLLVRKA
jgi:hypothetical protein